MDPTPESSEERALRKLAANGFPFDDLPNARNDLIWNQLQQEPCRLTLPEVSALKNKRFPTDRDVKRTAYEYFKVAGRCSHSQKYKGWRAMIYEFASKHSGCYQTVREETIFYEEDSLVFNIYFKSEESANLFIHEVTQCALRFNMADALAISDETSQVISLQKLAPIRLQHYKHEVPDESPEHSLSGSPLRADASDTASLVSLRDPTDVLLMLENSNLLQGLDVYNCHLMSQGNHKDEKRNSNNVLKMSWALHQRFDGLRTSAEHEHPQIAISFVSNDGREEVVVGERTLNRFRVTVAIEAEEQPNLNAVGLTLKAGSVYHAESNTWRSFVHVENAEEFQRCLTAKYLETKRIWGDA